MPIPLHRVRFRWGIDREIEIETARGRGKPCGSSVAAPALVVAEEETELDEFAERGIPAICWRDDVPPLFEAFQLRENTDYFIDVTVPVSKVEAEGEARRRQSWPFGERLSTVFKTDPARRWKETTNGGVVVTGQLRLKNHAGVLDLQTPFGTPLVAEVVCRKIDYVAEFQRLLDEVAEELAELLLQYESPVSFAFNISDVTSDTEAALLFQMRHIMAPRNLPAAVDEILRRIHTRLVDRTMIEAIASAEEPRLDALVDELDSSALKSGGPLARLFRGYTPSEITVGETYETVDTPENRFVKYFLEECFVLAQRLAQRLGDSGKHAASREAQEWLGRLNEMLAHSRWAEVGPFGQFPSNSQVLQRRRGYRDVVKYDLSLRLSLELPWKRGRDFADGLLGDVRPVNEIYEYWCFFVLRRTLKEICAAELPGNGSFISVTRDGLQVGLQKGKRSRISFAYKNVGPRALRVCLFYNRRFRRPNRALLSWEGSYTAFFDPDYSLLVTVIEGDRTRRHWLHFDAKYRLEVSELEAIFGPEDPGNTEATTEEDETEYDREITRMHKREDLFKMHTYRDGILSSRGAYILFPGDGASMRLAGRRQNLFVRHPSAFGGAPAHHFPSVGAFDLCPDRDGAQRAVLEEFLVGVFDALLMADSYEEENGLFSS
jgi:predicted component of viral defense system (DUF524 family)